MLLLTISQPLNIPKPTFPIIQVNNIFGKTAPVW